MTEHRSSKRRYVLAHQLARQRAVEDVRTAPEGYVVTVSEPRKSRDQEEKYHAMIGDIAAQWRFCDRSWDPEDMKRLCIDQFRRDTAKDDDLAPLWAGMGTVDLAPSIDGSGVVALGVQSRRFPKRLAMAFIEWLYALGAEHGVVWTDPVKEAA